MGAVIEMKQTTQMIPRKKMKIRFILLNTVALLLGGIILLGMTGCTGEQYAVDYCGQKDDYTNARDSYRAGEKVTLCYYLIATDTDYSFYLDDERLNTDYDENKGFIISFTMPEHDVKLECRSVNTMVENPDIQWER